MANNAAIVLGSLLLGGSILASGTIPDITKQYLLQQNRAACWDKSVTTGLNDLAAQEALPSFKQSYPNDMSQQYQDAISSSFSVTLSDYTFVGASNDWGSINCEAQISYSYTRPDKSNYTHNEGDIVSYTAHYGQYGWQSEMNGTSISPGLVFYKDDTPQQQNDSN